MPEADQAAVERMRAERLSRRAVARSAGVSRAWLQRFANRLHRAGTPHTPGRLKRSRAI